MSRISQADQTIQLCDGRILGYTEYGDANGKPVLYFHGHPGSRLEAGFLAGQAAQAGVRLISIDRPGMGLSTYKAGRRLLDWPDDVEELVNHLHLDRFAIVGFSGGGPYALACAYKIPQRLTACGIVAGVGRVSPLLELLSTWLPWLLLPLSRGMFQNQEKAEKSIKRFMRVWVKTDREAFSVPGVSESIAASLVEALRPGARGAAYDGTVLGRRNLGFLLEEITFPEIYTCHGELDNQIPVVSARELVKKIPHHTSIYYPNEGHISLIVNLAQEILEALI